MVKIINKIRCSDIHGKQCSNVREPYVTLFCSLRNAIKVDLERNEFFLKCLDKRFPWSNIGCVRIKKKKVDTHFVLQRTLVIYGISKEPFYEALERCKIRTKLEATSLLLYWNSSPAPSFFFQTAHWCCRWWADFWKVNLPHAAKNNFFFFA